MFKVTSTPNAPAAIGPYSQAICANGILFASGQIALDPATGEVCGSTIEEQAERCCQNVKGILEANGLTFEDVVKTTCFLADMKDFAAFNAVYAKYFTGKPARWQASSKFPAGGSREKSRRFSVRTKPSC